MSATPIVDAAIRAGCDCEQTCPYPGCLTAGGNTSNCRDHSRQSTKTLRAANPWEPPAEEIAAVAEVLFDPLRPEAATEDATRAYFDRPIIRELYPEKF